MPKPSGASSRQQPSSAAVAIEALAAELQGLERLDLAELRVGYRNRTGRIAPARISRPLLLRVLAHQIQIDAFGDLRRDTKRLLDRLAAATVGAEEGGGSAPIVAEPPFSLKPGTLLSREWQGRMESVMALEEGFAWNGKAYASLSAVAFAITGTRWNGHRFFGLRDGHRTAPSAEVHAETMPKDRMPRARAVSIGTGSDAERDGSSMGAQA